MPRKRKVQQALPAINEEADVGSSKPQDKEGDVDMSESKEGGEAPVQAIVKECREQAESKAEALIEDARQRALSLRAEAEAAINKLPKQVRQRSVVELFALTPEEAKASILYHVLPRLQVLYDGNDDPKAVDAARLVAARLASVAAAPVPQLVDAAAAAGPSAPVGRDQQQLQETVQQQESEQQQDTEQKQQLAQQQPKQQHSEQKRHREDNWQEMAQENQAAQQQQESGSVKPQALAGSHGKLTLMPPPPPRVPLLPATHRPPQANELVLYSANGSPVHLGQSFAPATTASGTIASITDATPAAGSSSIVAPPTMGFTGRTFRRAAPTRGRTKQPTRAITVTTLEGKQFTVDDLIGLAGVPQAYRDEVRRLVEMDHQDLSAIVQSMAVVEQENASAPASTARPTRRR